MRRVSVGSIPLERFGSHGVTIHHPTSAPDTLLASDGPATLVVAVLDAGGLIGRHPATGPQLMMVTAGTVQVTAGDAQVAGDDAQVATLRVGQAVLFEAGEQHETRAITAATLAIQEWTAAVV